MDQLQGIALALIPSVGIGFLFYKVIRLILEGDRKERLAHSRWDAQHVVASHPQPAGEQGPPAERDGALDETRRD